MRRRLRRLRRTREALVSDLGGLVVELHRHGRAQSPLITQRVQEVAAIDAEMRALAQALGSELTLEQVVVAGIAGTCARCGSLLSTSDRFCAHCGTPAAESVDGARGAAQGAPPPASPAPGPKPPPPSTARPLAGAPASATTPHATPPPPGDAKPLGTDAPPPSKDGAQTAGTRTAS